MFMIVKDSCVLVYTSNRIGEANRGCSDEVATAGNTSSSTNQPPLQKNNRKFESNGCSKVDRENKCNYSLFRG
jgi:hypothetical protein